eukprot:scaffold392_cov350-Prasinococcus_capsulatus_cf.AAC.6
MRAHTWETSSSSLSYLSRSPHAPPIAPARPRHRRAPPAERGSSRLECEQRRGSAPQGAPDGPSSSSSSSSRSSITQRTAKLRASVATAV